MPRQYSYYCAMLLLFCNVLDFTIGYTQLDLTLVGGHVKAIFRIAHSNQQVKPFLYKTKTSLLNVVMFAIVLLNFRLAGENPFSFPHSLQMRVSILFFIFFGCFNTWVCTNLVSKYAYFDDANFIKCSREWILNTYELQ